MIASSRRYVFATAMLATAAVSACSLAPSAAHPGDVDSARRILEEKVNDYPSARFQHVRLMKTRKYMTIFCGEVNAKNTMGAYVGWRRFFVMPTGNTGVHASINGFDDDRGSLTTPVAGSSTAPIDLLCPVGPDFVDLHDYSKDVTFTQ